MNAVAVPGIPQALDYLINPPRGQIRGETLMRKMVECDRIHKCDTCHWRFYCEFYHDFLIEIGAIENWHGVNENVTRYYK